VTAAQPAAADAPAPRRKRIQRLTARIGCAALAAALVLLALTPTGCYLSRAGYEEARILAARRPIREMIVDAKTDSITRVKLGIVLAARSFAADSIGLRVKESFTQYTRVKRDTLVLVLSAVPKDRLRAHTWWFPIVGSVPYKGYFDFGAARREQQKFERSGHDTYLRPAAAFSTLGWFNDPLLSTSLRGDTLGLAETVIHEVTHNTFYAAGQAPFNESFAEFVGVRGAAWFYRSRWQEVAAQRIEARWEDDKVLARFWERLYRQLDSAFRANPDDRERRLALRDSIYAAARDTLRTSVAPMLTTFPSGWVERIRLDNAALLARRIYATDLGMFDRVWEREGRDLKSAISRVTGLAKDAKDPFAAVRAWLDAPVSSDSSNVGALERPQSRPPE